MTEQQIIELSRSDLVSDQEIRWCPGCGDYAILKHVQTALADLGVARENMVVVSGIGCAARFPYYMNTYGFHTIHGRAPSFATGIKASRPELSVWVVTGDGDGLSIGGNHLLHTIRRNLDLQILLFNNRVYGLTKGQYSPTSLVGMKTKSTPTGSIDHPIDPIAFALGCGSTFVARTIDVDAPHMQETLRRAHAHKGTAFVEILQNCPVFNDDVWQLQDRKARSANTLMLQQGEPLVYGGAGERKGIVIENSVPRVVALADDEDPADRNVVVHDELTSSTSYAAALATLTAPDFPVPVGVFHQSDKACYEDLLAEQVDEAIAQRGPGDLSALLNSGDTWTVEP